MTRPSNIANIYEAYAAEFDREFLEKELAIEDIWQARTREARLYDLIGSRFGYSKPNSMEFVDYRLIVSNTKIASINGGTIEAVKLVCSAFTGVDPTIIPFSQRINFITADENLTIDNITVPSGFPYIATLSGAIRQDPIIPGTTISGPVTSVSELHTVSVSAPYTFTLINRPANIPTIAGYTFTNNSPAPNQFNVNFSTGVLTFNSANAGASLTVSYIPVPIVNSGTIVINIDADGAQTITLDAGPLNSKEIIAADIQTKVRALTAFTPANQPSYTNFIAKYFEALDEIILISGNQHPGYLPTITSSVVVTGGTAAAPLKLRAVDGAIQTTGLAYITPPSSPLAGQFRDNIDTGNGSLLTFHSSAANTRHSVLYKKKSTVYTYTPDTVTENLTIPGSSPYILTLGSKPKNIPSIPGFTYVNGSPGTNQFTVNFSTGILTFNVANAGAAVSISYVPDNPTPPLIFDKIEAGFAIKIILNNPGNFVIDRGSVTFLLKQVLPAYTKFVLI